MIPKLGEEALNSYLCSVHKKKRKTEQNKKYIAAVAAVNIYVPPLAILENWL